MSDLTFRSNGISIDIGLCQHVIFKYAFTIGIRHMFKSNAMQLVPD